jgi:signal transduction histidine kinase/integral membrane sensor domain MASE1
MSPPLVGLLFLTNCSEALIAASLVRWLSDAPTGFNTLRRVTVFIGAAIAAPVLSSFADATLVSVFRGEPYWTVWRIRTFANALTELSVVPCLVLAATAILRGVEWPGLQRRFLEAAVLVTGLTGVAVLVLGGWSSMPGLPRTPTVLLLPFFFWAATRFGVGGVSGLLLVAALVTSYETRMGHRPFEMLPPVESLMAVQMYLSLMGVPLMCVAGLLEERRRGSSDLRERLRFEGLLSAISGAFVHLPSAAPASAFDDPLRRVGEFLKVDYVGLLQTGEHGGGLEVTRQWCEDSAAALCGPQCVTAFPWAFARVAAGDTIVCETAESLPANATADRSAFESFGLQSAVVLPLVAGGQVQGALSVVTLTRRAWTGEGLLQLQLIAEVLANACARRRAEIELQRSRQELAHMARLSSMGELTASLAHQLNQPLAGILSNAQAARRFIDSGRATLPELRDIVVDIIADDQRAGEVIRRVREMLTRTERPAVALDANAIVRDVVALIASDAVLRNVSVSYDLTPEPLIITGHRIDVEHVLLNVITNGMDAVAGQPVPDRVVNVRTTRNGQDRALIIVHDSGEGLPAGMEHRIFEPFVSTKPSGMGMGLAVARSLVDDHGGSIRADNHPLGGAIVTISFPDASVTTRDPTRSSSRTAAAASQSQPS